MEGHIVSVLKNEHTITFPIISLLISGGHTELVLVKNWGHYQIIGQTLDDAIGEAFDKVARLMDLPYPGGPEVSKLAEQARLENLKNDSIKLPRPMLNSKDYNFSFSGIKTAVLYLIKKIKEQSQLDETTKKIIAREFEDAVTEVLFKKTERALGEFNAEILTIGGGVIANKNIREAFKKLNQKNIAVIVPEFDLATDNAVMIAMAGFLKSLRETAEIFPEIKAEGNLRL
jgi:N6-L-threonylcarbamoyladenine synthase